MVLFICAFLSGIFFFFFWGGGGGGGGERGGGHECYQTLSGELLQRWCLASLFL
jgi:hypothetical protein